jgi:hypothetical protein
MGKEHLMSERLRVWRPNQEELDRIMAEMRPIITEFAQRARQAVPGR